MLTFVVDHLSNRWLTIKRSLLWHGQTSLTSDSLKCVVISKNNGFHVNRVLIVAYNFDVFFSVGRDIWVRNWQCDAVAWLLLWTQVSVLAAGALLLRYEALRHTSWHQLLQLPGQVRYDDSQSCSSTYKLFLMIIMSSLLLSRDLLISYCFY